MKKSKNKIIEEVSSQEDDNKKSLNKVLKNSEIISDKDFFLFQIFKKISKINYDKTEDIQLLQILEEALHYFTFYVSSIEFTPKKGKSKKFTYNLIINETPEIFSFEDVEEKEALNSKESINKKLDQIIQGSVITELIEATIIDPIIKYTQQGNKGTYKRSGYFIDQLLKYDYPKANNRQLSLFETLKKETKKDIEIAGIEIKELVEGIKLSPSETKVIDCLLKLLHDNSQTIDPDKEDYYSGNRGYELVKYGGVEDTPAPKLAFTLYELTKEYKGGEYVSGKDIDNVKQFLKDLDSKRFLISYIETTKKKDGGRIERKIEDFRKLIHILNISEIEYNKDNIELSKKEETVIVLNPIFKRHINTKFIKTPVDINRRTIIAYGSHNVSDIALRLRDYLMRELSSKRYEPQINLDRLYYMLSEKWMKESRKKKVKEYTDKGLETVKALGLLLSYELKTSSTGEPKIIFKLNKDWQ